MRCTSRRERSDGVKLSDIRGERVFDVIAEVMGPIANIALDEDAARMFRRETPPDGVTPWQLFLGRLRDSLPVLCTTHRDDLVSILAAISGVPRDEYMDGLTLGGLFSDMIELVTDTEFVSFFA